MRAPYLLALCEAARQSNVTFGVATRLGTQSSTFNVDAVRLIDSLLQFSPSPESVATAFLRKFRRAPDLDLHNLGVFLSYLSTCP